MNDAVDFKVEIVDGDAKYQILVNGERPAWNYPFHVDEAELPYVRAANNLCYHLNVKDRYIEEKVRNLVLEMVHLQAGATPRRDLALLAKMIGDNSPVPLDHVWFDKETLSINGETVATVQQCPCGEQKIAPTSELPQ